MPYIGKKPADIIATAVDTTTGTFSGAVSASSVDADGGVTVDNITIDGTEIDLSSGNLTLDVAGQLIVNSDSGQVVLQDDTVNWGNLQNSSGDFIIGSLGADKDIKIQGLDGSSTIDALTFDMSNAGQANFNSSIFTGNTAEFVDGTGTGDKGIQLNPIGLTISTRNGGVSGIFGRQASDGEIIQVRKDGSSVGGIGSASGDLTIGTGDSGLRFYDAGPAIYPRDTSGNDEDGTVDLGLSSARFKDIYLSGGVRVGGTGSANLLNDYEEGTWTPVYTAGTAPTVSYNTQDGKYTKIGQTVAFNCRIATNSTSGGSGSVYITGLPFANSKISSGAVVAAYWTGENPMKYRIVSSGIFLYYRGSLTGNDINNNTQTNDFNTSATGGNLIEVTGVYFTDS